MVKILRNYRINYVTTLGKYLAAKLLTEAFIK